MFFAGLFAMYFTSRANGIGNGSWKEGAAHLNVPYAMVITAILISSSVTAQFGVFAAERGDVFGLRRWYLLTIVLGTTFLVGQGYEYYHLIEHGLTIPSSVYLRGGDAADRKGEIHPGAGNGSHGGVLLLALRGRRVDRLVYHHLLHSVGRIGHNEKQFSDHGLSALHFP